MKTLLCLLMFFNAAVSYAAARVISLAPNLTEIVYSLGAQEELVGNTLECNYPLDALKKQKVGHYNEPNFERIIQMKPTLVLAAQGNPRKLLERLKKLKITILEIEPQSISQLPSAIEKVGAALKKEKEAAALIKKIENAVTSLENKKQTKTALIALQMNPVYAVADKTWIGELFKKAGFANIANDSSLQYPKLSDEFILKKNPEFFLVLSEEKKEEINLAIKRIFKKEYVATKIVQLKPDVFVRAGPRVIEAIEELQKIK